MKLDWAKAVKERPGKMAQLASLVYALHVRREACLQQVLRSIDDIVEAARVQSVAEADRAYVDAMIKGLTFEEREALLDECKSARAREAAEEESHKKGGSCWGGEQ